MRVQSATSVFLGVTTMVVLVCVAGLGSVSAGTAGQFYAYFGEVTSSDQGGFCYLACYSLMLTLPQVWVVSFGDSQPAQPVLYKPFASECPDSVWQAWKTLTQQEGKRTELHGLERFDLEVRLSADSTGVDTLCGATSYQGALVAEAAGGRGTVSLTMFCDTLIRIRGVYQLPGRPEKVVFITYKGTACECQEVNLPIVIYPK
jgi:hypothetical protein